MAIKEDTKEQRRVLLDRREALSCMTWAGTGLLWTLSGGVPLTSGFIDGALAGGHAAGGSGLGGGSSTDAFWRF